MALFKFRKSSDDQPAKAPPTETVEVIRKRARHRLIGAAVLVLAGVLGFPLLFDSQPRPLSVDIPIEIPDKARVKPLSLPITEPAADTAAVVAPAASAVAAAVPMITELKEPPAHAVSAPVAPKNVANVDSLPLPKPAPPVPPKADDATKVQALLDGKADAKEAAPDGRYIVQVGAFADAAKAREARLKVERAGLKTYTQSVDTKDGKRIRVRVGPFFGKTEAAKAAEKIKKLDLPAAILTL